MANQPITGYYRKAYQDFSGGLDDFSDSLIVKQNQFCQLTNALVNSTGVLEKAKGYSLDGSPFPDVAANFIRMLVNYRRGVTVDKLVCAALDTTNTNTTYKVDLKETIGDGNYAYFGHTAGTEASFTTANTAVTGVSTTWASHLKAGDKIKALGHADTAYTEIATVNSNTSLTLVAGGYLGATAAATQYKARMILNKDFLPSAVVFNNNLIITNGADTPMTYNNTTLNNITDADVPKGKFIAAHKSRVFIAGTSGGPSSIFWSAINDETSWDATAFEIIFANDNGNICGIKSFADSLIILKDNGNIYQAIGSFDQDAVGEPDFIRKIDTPVNIGAIAGFSAQVHDNNKLIFVAETGVYALDPQMYVEKISWDIQNATDDLVLRSGTVSEKGYAFDTQTQWNYGSMSSPASTRSTSDGKIKRINDSYTITDASKTDNLCSVRCHSNGDIHIVYVGTDGKTIKHVKKTIDEVSTATDVLTAAATILDMSVDINTTGDLIVGYFTTGSVMYAVEKLVAGAWGSPTTVVSPGFTALSCALRYGNLTQTNVYGTLAVTDGTYSVFHVFKRVSGTWSQNRIFSNSSGSDLIITGMARKMDVVLTPSTDNFAFSFLNGTTTLETYQWTSGTWYYVSASYTVGITANAYARTEWFVNSTSERIITFSDGATIKSRNIDASSSATLDASYGNHTGLYLGSTNAWAYMRFNASGTETLVYANSTAVANTTTATMDVTSKFPNRGFDSNGTVYASCYFGANANEIIVRRIAAIGIWTSPEQSDATMQSWLTYEITGQVNAEDAVGHEVAVNTISPPSTFYPITSGTIINADDVKIFVKARITFTMGGFTTPEVGSLTLNYTGAGVGASLPTAMVFNNEYYLAYGNTGDNANSTVLMYDKRGAWQKLEYPVYFMTRYRGALYGGSSTSGKVFKLIQAYRMVSSAYTLTATSKEDLLGSMELSKEAYKVYVIYKIKSTGTFDFSYRLDNFSTPGGATWVNTTVDQTGVGMAEIPMISGLFKSIQFKITSSTIDNELGIIGWVIVYGYANLR